MLKVCEYCEENYDDEESDAERPDEFCSYRHEELEENYRKCEAAADSKFEEMAYGPRDNFEPTPTWEQEPEY
jgi:hypothetical protein